MRQAVLCVFNDLLKSLLLSPLLCMLLRASKHPDLATLAFAVLSILAFVNYSFASTLDTESVRDVTHRRQTASRLEDAREETLGRYAALTLVFLAVTLIGALSPEAETLSVVNLLETGGVITLFSSVFAYACLLMKIFETAELIMRLPKRDRSTGP